MPDERVAKPFVFVAHGTLDSVIPVELGGDLIVRELRQQGYDVAYRRFRGGHRVLPRIAREAVVSTHDPVDLGSTRRLAVAPLPSTPSSTLRLTLGWSYSPACPSPALALILLTLLWAYLLVPPRRCVLGFLRSEHGYFALVARDDGSTMDQRVLQACNTRARSWEGWSSARAFLTSLDWRPGDAYPKGGTGSRVQPPYGGYATILAAFGGTLAATAGVERLLGRDVPEPSRLDYLFLCAASFKAARAISRERVGSVIRQPFVDAGPEEIADTVSERPAGDGLRLAVGELVTCTRCAGTWAAAGLLLSRAVAPRFGRLLTMSLAAGATNDFLQAAFTALCAREAGTRSQ